MTNLFHISSEILLNCIPPIFQSPIIKKSKLKFSIAGQFDQLTRSSDHLFAFLSKRQQYHRVRQSSFMFDNRNNCLENTNPSSDVNYEWKMESSWTQYCCQFNTFPFFLLLLTFRS